MRTTLTLDPDVAAKTRRAGARLGKSMKETVNAALRIGLDHLLRPAAAKPYRTQPRALRLKSGYSLDNVAELLAVAEDDEHK